MTAALAAGSLRPAAGASPRWLRCVVYGVLWGAVVTAAELLELPIGDLSGMQQLSLAVDLFAVWCVAGVGIAAIGLYAGARAGGAVLASLFVLLALATSAVEIGLLRLARDYGLPTGHDYLFPAGIDPWAGFLFNCWAVLCYGGIFLLALVLNVRADRTRRLLTQAEIARSRTEARYSEARLQALRGHVDPVFLLRVLDEVERRHAGESADADGLLDQLVGFLRSAMPGLRSGASTVVAEVGLAAAYTQLRAALELRHVTWRFNVATPLPDVPFPPLLLLPVLDALDAAAPQHAQGDLTLARHGEGVTLALHLAPGAADDWLPAPLAYRLRVALDAMAGGAWTLTPGAASAPGAPALTLTGLLATASGAAAATRFSDFTSEGAR